MHIDIWSDVVCPWCYLGKRRLERALEVFEHRSDVTIAHRSFQLDPSRPRHQTTSRRQMLMAKYRLSEDQVKAMDQRMEQTAAADGLTYHLTDAGQTGNTLDAHRLLHLAKARSREDAMLDRLYRA
jgi:predicted DsbA family dithiol-disulfide isomerase